MIKIFDISTAGKPLPNILNCMRYLSEKGYRVQIKEDVYQIFKVEGQIVKEIFKPELVNVLVEYFQHPNVKAEFPIEYTIGVRDPQVIEISALLVIEGFNKYGWGKILRDENFVHMEKIEVKKPRHKRRSATWYFSNCMVEVTATGITTKDYSKLDHYVLSDDIVPRNFTLLQENEMKKGYQQHPGKGNKGADFLDFLKRVCFLSDSGSRHEKTDTSQHPEKVKDSDINGQKMAYLTKLIGYLLHEYKEPGATDFGVWICDNEQGGSGKDLIVKAISQMTKVCSLDCRRKLPEHDPIELNENTRVKHFMDVKQSYSLGEVFNEITNQNSIHHKYDHPRTIPYSDGFKLVFTANYFPKGSDDADKRRLEPVLVYPFFNRKTRVHEFYGHSFWSESWQEQDWNFFYNLMLGFVSSWLECEYKHSAYHYEDEEYNLLKLEANYAPEFIEFMNSLKSGMYESGKLHEAFIDENKDSGGYVRNKYIRERLQSNRTLFGRMVKSYCNEKEWRITKNHNRTEVYINKDGKPSRVSE